MAGRGRTAHTLTAPLPGRTAPPRPAARPGRNAGDDRALPGRLPAPRRLDARRRGPRRPTVPALRRTSALRPCRAPRRAELPVKEHPRPRQEWCTPSCGNRARVARHHERHRTPWVAWWV
ncbi:CGNR zinc finger domain-containing protein [Streptomyces sp. NPDC087428]|uniref:CGNR zinc finger domain-containing protein n=1 Tax=Streptomyces sp. NPDC087428 TaxID=3365788 RepID=UPI0037FC512A